MVHKNIRSVKDLSLGSIICFAIIGIIPFILVYFVITQMVLPDLKTVTWDNATGTVISAITTDTGRTEIVSTGTHSHITVRIYNSVINYTYEDEGQSFTKSSEKELEDREVKEFHKKYFEGAKIELKINPQDRSIVVIKPDYATIFIILIASISMALPFFIIFSVVLPHTYFKSKNTTQDPSKLKHKFEAQKFNRIDFKDTGNLDIEWTPMATIWSAGFFNTSKTDSVLSIKRKMGCLYVLLSPFLAIGIFLLTQDLIFGIFWFIVLLLISSVFFIGNKCIFFDKLKGYYWKGKAYASTNELLNSNPTDLTPLSQIKALQVLYYEDPKPTSKHDSTRYEVNLILRDDRRINVDARYTLQEIKKLAEQIAEFINVRILLDPKIDKESYIALS